MKNNSKNILSNFCVSNLEYWIEKEVYNPLLSDLNFCDKNLYLLTNYYENEDIYEYLEKLEKMDYNFTENFYWDLAFEMIMGLLFIHECGYIHNDIQPAKKSDDKSPENQLIKLREEMKPKMIYEFFQEKTKAKKKGKILK